MEQVDDEGATAPSYLLENVCGPVKKPGISNNFEIGEPPIPDRIFKTFMRPATIYMRTIRLLIYSRPCIGGFLIAPFHLLSDYVMRHYYRSSGQLFN